MWQSEIVIMIMNGLWVPNNGKGPMCVFYCLCFGTETHTQTERHTVFVIKIRIWKKHTHNIISFCCSLVFFSPLVLAEMDNTMHFTAFVLLIRFNSFRSSSSSNLFLFAAIRCVRAHTIQMTKWNRAKHSCSLVRIAISHSQSLSPSLP